METRSKRKRENKSHKRPLLAELPEDIVTEILTHLPVKSLITYRCVCKSWLNLFSTSKFIKTHLSKSYLSNNLTHQSLILRHIDDHCDRLKSCLFSFGNSSGFSNAVEVDYRLNHRRHVSIVGSCNGLLCIAIEKFGVLLCNLSTRIQKKVPFSGINFRLDFLTNYGFGYDVLNDDFKLVWVVSVLATEGMLDEKGVRIYSLKTGSWRKIGDFPHGIPCLDFGKYVNGRLHWIVIGACGFNSSMVIVSLDLGNETYGEIAQPCYGGCKISSLCLGVLEGCLSVFCHFEKRCCDIWVMKEYGVRDTWMKLYTIPYKSELAFPFYYPLCICISGEILLEYWWRLYLYNPRNGRLRNLKIGNLPGKLRGLEATTYVESLVSPNITK